MKFHENKVELSLTLEKLPIREARSDELGTFLKVQETKKPKQAGTCPDQICLFQYLHRAVNRQPGYPRETPKAKLKILQRNLGNL